MKKKFLLTTFILLLLIVLFAEPVFAEGSGGDNFWEDDSMLALIGIIIIILEAIIIIVLLKCLGDKRKAEKNIKEQNKILENEVKLRTRDLEYANTKLSAINEELQNSCVEIEQLATHDKLTNIGNRFKIDEIVKNEIERYRRAGDIFAVIVVEIDFFKKINSDYGQETGDKILKECAELLKNSIRRVDDVGRMGDDKFMIICPDTRAKGAIVLAESLRRRVADNLFDDKYDITISLGVTEIVETDNDEEAIYKRADETLNDAVNNGRNCVSYGGKSDFDFLNDTI